MFVRANTAGVPLAYSDLLLATATAKWETLDARSEIHDFTDSLNKIGEGYRFGKDFVLKACLYLSEDLPIQYKVKNFTRQNLRIIEGKWGKTKESNLWRLPCASFPGSDLELRILWPHWRCFRLPSTS